MNSETPVTSGEIIRLLTILSIEIVAACSVDSKQANDRLTDIANRLDDFGTALIEPRQKWLTRSLAAEIIGTENGG